MMQSQEIIVFGNQCKPVIGCIFQVFQITCHCQSDVLTTHNVNASLSKLYSNLLSDVGVSVECYAHFTIIITLAYPSYSLCKSSPTAAPYGVCEKRLAVACQ